jgi:hypothetical protein
MGRAVVQPTPDVSEKDVERIVRRDFPAEQREAVLDVLRDYSKRKLARECPRVQLAALKLAQGSLKRLRLCIDDAQRDYRDVLAAAQYPEYMIVPPSRMSQMSRKEQLRIVNNDWDQCEMAAKMNGFVSCALLVHGTSHQPYRSGILRHR